MSKGENLEQHRQSSNALGGVMLLKFLVLSKN